MYASIRGFVLCWDSILWDEVVKDTPRVRIEHDDVVLALAAVKLRPLQGTTESLSTSSRCPSVAHEREVELFSHNMV